MGRIFSNWRYYSFGKEPYQDCMNKIFVQNLNSLCQTNILFAGFTLCYAIFFFLSSGNILAVENIISTGICLGNGIIATLFAVYLNYKMQTVIPNSRFIYIFITLFFVNVMAFSIYLGIWVHHDTPATLFLCFLLCSLLMFVNPPIFNLCLTGSAILIFSVCSILFKTAGNFIFDIANALIAGVFGLFFSWHFTKTRLGLELSTTMLEDERNKYLEQSTVDVLTQLNNRRDFMKTFQRYFSNYRTDDDYLCVAIGDIDFFKNYNDHYGHPKGDECLRSVGGAFNKVKENMGVYAARVGGEEFALLWFEKDASHVDAVVSYLSSLIRNMKIPHEKSKVSEFVTMSIGVYVERTGTPGEMQTLYDLADQALYHAKEGGRNCAIITGREIEQYKIQSAK